MPDISFDPDNIALPRLIPYLHYYSTILTGSAPIEYTIDTLQMLNTFAYQNPAGNGDSWQVEFICDAGTYTLAIFGVKFSNRGLLDIYIDDVKKISLQDWYNAARVYNVGLYVPNIVISAGAHILKGVINGKNVASSDYYMALTHYWLTRMGA